MQPHWLGWMCRVLLHCTNKVFNSIRQIKYSFFYKRLAKWHFKLFTLIAATAKETKYITVYSCESHFKNNFLPSRVGAIIYFKGCAPARDISRPSGNSLVISNWKWMQFAIETSLVILSINYFECYSTKICCISLVYFFKFYYSITNFSYFQNIFLILQFCHFFSMFHFLLQFQYLISTTSKSIIMFNKNDRNVT